MTCTVDTSHILGPTTLGIKPGCRRLTSQNFTTMYRTDAIYLIDAFERSSTG
ncbi:hypothetical protein CY34DRAFT_800235 [Suillus luteus UH-Slu-Lm8-n1]|uniref:Uncharacterized protein n=1 Tax=Suillus luteus UH-Slu-Lm8-n1 TaxID=930992 RepID=A0A0D0A8V8_9AGAM|nr:hypothetical protein CY34DRAFT_800235 [Suillus luteus UH-Slu-Lm8-n1]